MTIKPPVSVQPVTENASPEVLGFVDSTLTMLDVGLHSPNGETLAVIEATDEDGRKSLVLILVIPSDGLAFVPIGVLTPHEGDFSQPEFVDGLLAGAASFFQTDAATVGPLTEETLAELNSSFTETFSFVDTTAVEADVEAAFYDEPNRATDERYASDDETGTVHDIAEAEAVEADRLDDES